MAESDHNGATLFQAGAPARAARAEMMGRTNPWADHGGQRESGQETSKHGSWPLREEEGPEVRRKLAEGHHVSTHARD